MTSVRRGAPNGASLQDDASLMRRQRPPTSRRRALLVFLTAIPLAVSMLGAVPHASADDLASAQAQQRSLQAKIQAQQRSLGALRQQEATLQAAIAATDGQLAGINANQAQLAAQIARATAALAATQQQFDALSAQLDQLDWTLGILQGELEQSTQDLQARKRLLGERLAEAYRTQQTSLLEQILSADSLTTVLGDVGNYLSLGDQDAQLASQIQADQANLLLLQKTTDATRFKTDQLALAVQQQAAQLLAQRQALAAAKAKVDALKRQTQQILAQQQASFRKVYATRAAAAAELARQQAAQAALNREIARLIAAQSSNWSIPSVYSGTLSWPMPGIVTQEFGCTGVISEPPLGSCPHFHQGIDIANAYGTPIHAAGDGTVIFVGYNPYDSPPQAWIVVIAHSSSLQSLYAHMIPSRPDGIYVGAHVSRGQLIGWEGSTGHSTGPHLHWGVFLDGSAVNPRLFL